MIVVAFVALFAQIAYAIDCVCLSDFAINKIERVLNDWNMISWLYVTATTLPSTFDNSQNLAAVPDLVSIKINHTMIVLSFGTPMLTAPKITNIIKPVLSLQPSLEVINEVRNLMTVCPVKPLVQITTYYQHP